MNGCILVLFAYRHPLFPLLTCLFEKCEKATVLAAGMGISSESFDEDILSFVRQQEQSGKPFFVDNPEVDGLVSYFHNCKLQLLLCWSGLLPLSGYTFNFYRASAGCCRMQYCFSKSVCLSVPLWYCVEMNSHVIKLFPS